MHTHAPVYGAFTEFHTVLHEGALSHSNVLLVSGSPCRVSRSTEEYEKFFFLGDYFKQMLRQLQMNFSPSFPREGGLRFLCPLRTRGSHFEIRYYSASSSVSGKPCVGSVAGGAHENWIFWETTSGKIHFQRYAWFDSGYMSLCQ